MRGFEGTSFRRIDRRTPGIQRGALPAFLRAFKLPQSDRPCSPICWTSRPTRDRPETSCSRRKRAVRSALSRQRRERGHDVLDHRGGRLLAESHRRVFVKRWRKQRPERLELQPGSATREARS